MASVAETTKVDREDFLRRLEEVEPGLARREVIQQSSCFVFVNGRVCTFNEDVACRTKSGLPKDLVAAVQAKPLVELVRDMRDKFLEIGVEGERFLVKGKQAEEARIRMESTLLLPLDAVDKPGEWKRLHEDFIDAVTIVHECASDDQTAPRFTCVHVHPDYMEACDNKQLVRFKLPTGVKKPVLVRAESLAFVLKFELTEMSETENYLHFRGPSGMVLSCRKTDEEYEDFDDQFKVKGEKAVLPRVLLKAVRRANIFSSDADKNKVKVSIKPGGLRIVGVGAIGEYKKVTKFKYKGKPMQFYAAPALLQAIVERYQDCQISDNHKLKVNGGKFCFLASLDVTEQED